MMERNVKVLEILSGPLKFMYANQLLGMILWMDIMWTVVCVKGFLVIKLSFGNVLYRTKHWNIDSGIYCPI